MNAGYRERMALLKWWGATEPRNAEGYRVAYLVLLEEATYDPGLDAIIVPGCAPITIQDIDTLEEGYGTLRGRTTLKEGS
jgi:hypothetical protein